MGKRRDGSNSKIGVVIAAHGMDFCYYRRLDGWFPTESMRHRLEYLTTCGIIQTLGVLPWTWCGNRNDVVKFC